MHFLIEAGETLSYRPDLEKHCRNVAKLVLESAKNLRLPEVESIAAAAYLHDLGKTTWPDELYNKYPLSGVDWNLVRAHPLLGENFTLEIWPDAPKHVLALIRGHHERPGGNGYPDGLAEPSIEILLLAACDAYDAMTSERAYRSSGIMSIQHALMEVARFSPPMVIAALAMAVIENDCRG